MWIIDCNNIQVNFSEIIRIYIFKWWILTIISYCFIENNYNIWIVFAKIIVYFTNKYSFTNNTISWS